MNNIDVLKEVCDNYLDHLFNPVVAAKWWNLPNEAFMNDVPENVFRRNPMDVVYYLRRVYAFENGVYHT